MSKLEMDYRDKKEFLEKLNETYDQIEEINSGGGGIIYKAIHRRLKRKVVLKKIRSDRLSIIGSEREMKILMSLKHTYLPGILDFWSYEDEVYTVMEFIEGRSFQELLQEGRKFSEKEVIKWTRQLAEVLEYLHNSAEHIIHSDIKPANLMLTTTNDICLIDFNVSILQGGEDETIGYSASYSPVEQLIQKEAGSKKRKNKNAAEGGETYEYITQPVAQNRSADSNAAADDGTEIDDCTQIDDRTEIDDDRTQIDDRTEIDDDRTQIDDRTKIDDRTEIDDDRTQIDDATEISTDYRNVKADEKVYSKLNTDSVSKATMAPKQQVVYQKPSLEELQKRFGKRLKVDERSDIYSACATMYHILTGYRPAPCYAAQKPIEELLPSVNDAFAYILMHGMEQHPKDRYQSAGKMLKALRQLMKSTKRYKRMLRRQDTIIVLLVGVFLASAGAAYFGWGMRLQESITGKMEQATLYYEQGDYQQAAEYLEAEVLTNSLYQESSLLSDAYYLNGNCYLEQEQYAEAVTEYRKAILLDSSKAHYYREYGIALTRNGQLEEAKECLVQASVKQLADDSILLLRGEIAALSGDYEGALEYLQESINTTKDPYILLSAGLKADSVLKEAYGDVVYEDRIRSLEMLEEKLPEERTLPLLQRMIQVYGDYGQYTQDIQYTQKAVILLDQIITSGYATLVEWMDKGIYLQSMGSFEESRACFETALEKYPDQYLLYKRLAFLELDVQSAKENGLRDYTVFTEYYESCIGLYEKSNAGEQDLEIPYLQNLYRELEVLGWLK